MSRDESSVRDALRVRPGTVNLAGYDTAGPLDDGKGGKGGKGGKKNKGSKDKRKAATGSGRSAIPEQDAQRLADLQERLFAERTRSVLLVLQGIDTAGKGGVVGHVVRLLGPEGVTTTAFKQPTPEEQAHHFLWRIRKRLPNPGMVAVFDRSHYEDVIVARVHELVPEVVWRGRYGEINEFETQLVESGTAVVKCFLHISYATQRARLLERLDDPTKRWKFHEGDIDERAYWSDYQAAYTAMLQECSTEGAPWYVVPSDDKAYRNWAIARILDETLSELDPQYPQPDIDLDRMRARLAPPH
jgi:PPK2 family polyphosphate:nucleotide phosphotransferase